MSHSDFDTRIKIQQIVNNQLPEFVLSESQNITEFLKQYYISQEYQGGPVDILDNLDQYVNLDKLTDDVVSREYNLTQSVSVFDDEIFVNTTIGFPKEYGLLKINDEIITYTGITTNSFTGCVRGFSGIDEYTDNYYEKNAVFKKTEIAEHSSGDVVINLSSLFLKEFYKKIKFYLTPGLENIDFSSNINIKTFIKNSRNFYKTKGTEESFRILFNVLYGVTPKVVDLENFVIKPSAAEYVRRKEIVCELISGDNPTKLSGQTIFSSDGTASAPVSEVEIFTRNYKSYYKISIYEGYDEKSLIEGTFKITPKTKVIDDVLIGNGRTITVDSTIGFPNSGQVIVNGNLINYTDKSINQFFNCDVLVDNINSGDDVILDYYIYGYTDSDSSQEVRLIILGSLSDFSAISDVSLMSGEDKIYINNLGDYIENPIENKSYKEIVFNSWIYNTKSRYKIDLSESNTKHKTRDYLDKSSIRQGDLVEILQRDTNNVVANAQVNYINENDIEFVNYVALPEYENLNLRDIRCDFRRKVKYVNSNIPIKYENIVANVQNTYNENDQNIYVASNSLPESINASLSEASIPNGSSTYVKSSDNEIVFDVTSLPFISGDEIVYSCSNDPITGLESGNVYYVKLVDGFKNKIKLYLSRALIYNNTPVNISHISSPGTHTFEFARTYNKSIVSKKNLVKLPLNKGLNNGLKQKTNASSPIGILINGVDIFNYKSNDKIYYGPIESVKVLNEGLDYDVINPPLIEVSAGVGTTALVQPHLSGSLKMVLLKNLNVEVNDINSISLVGGNGSGAVLTPIIEKRFKEYEFSASLSNGGVGIDTTTNQIVFSEKHYIKSGDPLVYSSNGNDGIGIRSFTGPITDSGRYLNDGSIYYPKVVTPKNIVLYQSFNDYQLGINTVGFTTTNAYGIHKFRTFSKKNILADIKVLESGQNYQNKKIILKPDSINTFDSTIVLKNHGLRNGEDIEYLTTGTPVSGLSTATKYKVLRINNDQFRLCDSGSEGNDTDNFINKKYARLTSTGSGYHIFKYPDIKISINVSYAQTDIFISADPIVRGQIKHIQVYEGGSGYGTTILNFHKKPILTITNGKNAILRPIIVNGKIIDVEVQNAGENYYSIPDVEVIGSGNGAKIYPIIENNKLTGAQIIRSGVGYDDNTKINVVTPGSEFKYDISVRSLTINNQKRYGDYYLNDLSDGISYSVLGYSDEVKDYFQDNITNDITHSPIIGWAYDGNPIYGPYGYVNPNNSNSGIRILNTGYFIQPVADRPTSFENGLFVEDYVFNNAGDLDEHNGRFCKTPEFPNGTYAYFVGIKSDTLNTNQFESVFPYFIGDTYRSKILEDVLNVNQRNFNFDSSELIRNTFPYRTGQKYSSYDYIDQFDTDQTQVCAIDSIQKGSIDFFTIEKSGENYKVNDSLVFDNTDSSGYGINAKISEIKLPSISQITTGISTYQNVKILRSDNDSIDVYISPSHNLKNNDEVTISGISTFIKGLVNNHRIKVSNYKTTLLKEIPDTDIVGLVTDIYVNSIPKNVSIGSSIGIGTEFATILNYYPINKILRIKRSLVGIHTIRSLIEYVPDSFTIKLVNNDSKINYHKNDKIYFNPSEFVGFGTIAGISTSLTYQVGELSYKVDVPTQSIYLPNNNFKHKERIIFRKPNGSNTIQVSNTPDSTAFNLPFSGNEQTLYVIKKSNNYIGLVTQIGLTTTSDGIYFRNYVSSGLSTDYEYSFEPVRDEVIAKVESIKSIVSISTSHYLSDGDDVVLNIIPNTTAGIGNSTSVRVKYNETYKRLLVNPIGFTSSSVNSDENLIQLTLHGLKTGDKVFYDSEDLVLSGLSTGEYFVYKIDDNKIKLVENYFNLFQNPPTFISIGGVGIGSTGGSNQSISKINPYLTPISGNNLKFDLSDSSLNGYDLKIYYDEQFINEFYSTTDSSTFNVVRSGQVGISSQANLIINYDSTIPQTLYYSITKNGLPLKDDVDVINHSKITFIPSFYNKKYSITSVGSTTFQISLNTTPETLTYNTNDLLNSEIYTDSLTSYGSISKIKTIFKGVGYEKFPKNITIDSETGKNGLIYPNSSSIGKINEIRILNQGFSYPSDKTLKPKALLPSVLNLKNNNEISDIIPQYGGRGYYSKPNLVVVDFNTREVVNNGTLDPIIENNSITSVKIVSPPRGLDFGDYEVFTINNTNGVGISSISYSSFSGNVTCTLFTPIAGFPSLNIPFQVGDLIFVEGIEKVTGKGFNSADYGYSFFEVTSYVNSNPAVLTFNLSSYTQNAGVPTLSQNNFATIVNYGKYPRFSVYQKPSQFNIGEKISISYDGNSFEKTDSFISDYGQSYLKISGPDQIKNDYTIKGEKSGSLAKVSSNQSNVGLFSVDYFTKNDLGWKNEIGKTSVDTQYLPDNDYYQNLSYTIKSPLEYEKLIDPVNKILHPTGLKNFADVGITSETKYTINNASVATIVVDLIEENRVDTVFNFDNAIDYDVRNSRSKYVDLYSKRLSSYIKCLSNRALQIDDISDEFSSKTFTQEEYLDIITYPRGIRYSKFFVQTIGIGTNEYQVDDLVVLNDLNNSFTFNRGTLTNSVENDNYVTLRGNIDQFLNLSLRLEPNDPYEKSYEIKTYRNIFNNAPVGLGTTSFGFTSLTSLTKNTTSGQTTEIIGIGTNKINSLYAEILLVEKNTNILNFFEIVIDHDGQNTYKSEYYFDTTNSEGSSSNSIGSFESQISDNNLVLNFTNNSNNDILVKSRIIGIGTTSAGIGTYRFKSEEQPDDTERSIKFESNYKIITSASPIITVDRTIISSYKSLVRVKNNEKVALHEILFLNDGENSFILPKYFLTVNNTTGIGTFGTEYSGYDAILKFYPDNGLSGNFEIQTYTEFLYKDLDPDNEGQILRYGTIEESVINSQYNSINGDGNDRYDFDLKYNGTPIFTKKFNPSLSSVLNKESGIFTIKDHFFNSGEEIIYTPGSAFAGLPVSSIGIGSTLAGGSLFVGDIISGLSTITGISTSDNIQVGQEVLGNNIQPGTTIISIGSTFNYFKGNVISAGSSVITGIGNTTIISVGSGIYSGNGQSLGQVVSVGINSITSTVTIGGGNDRIYYTDTLGIGVSLSQVALGSTVRQSFICGITTNVCPSTVYAIKLSNDQFKITSIKNSGLGITFTSPGQGNAHQFEIVKKNEKTLITVDGVIQYPLKFTNINYNLQNNGGTISSTASYFALSGISSIKSNDILKIDNEYIKVLNVGLGTTSIGPVSNVGSYNVIYGERGFFGTQNSSHNDSSTVGIYRGTYNISGNKIYFIDPPKGSGRNNAKNNSNLDLPRSTFVGRVFLRNDYTNNIIYDDFSEEFTGIGRTYTIKYLGNNVKNIEPGSGLLFINEIFQTPTTENNEGNNYELNIIGNSKTEITFTGIRSKIDDELIISEQDINQNQLPRGGVIVSVGSTSGLGFAPLVGASVTAVVGAGGSIVSVGIGSTDIVGSGYYNQVSVAITDTSGVGSGAIISATVGAGGTLSFNVVNGGSNYSTPKIFVSEPSYSNLPVTGLFRVGLGTTSTTGIGLSITVDVEPRSTTGIGSTYFEVSNFRITKNGYGFKNGDVFKPVGLVTAKGLNSPIEDFSITVLETFTDSVALWQFGELDYIDSIENLQDNLRRRFPLYRNRRLLSFETDDNDPNSSVIDLDSILVIFVNGILQEPKVAYTFEGGTTVTFSEPPRVEDKVDIFFYRGTRNVDSFVVNTKETIKVGDDIRISNSPEYDDPYNQFTRTIFDVLSSDTIETNLYSGVGINTINYKHLSWTKQKSDKIINNLNISKARDSLSSLIFPTAKIIKNFTTSDNEIFVDNSELFLYEQNVLGQEILSFDCVLAKYTNPISASLTATVSNGSLSGITILDGGNGYGPTGSEIFIKISNPISGVGVTAIAKVTVSAAGTVTSPSIVNAGLGYSSVNPPQIIVPFSSTDNNVEILSNCSFVQGFSGIVTGITTSSGTGGHPLALNFLLKRESGSFDTLASGYPISIDNTSTGFGVTSVDSNDSSIVGIGTSFLNNIYYVHSITSDGSNASILCNIHSNSNVVGINTFGLNLGTFSWGKISNFNRSDNPIEIIVSGNTVDVGLSTFSQVQRRGYGLRDTGSLKK